MITVTKYIVVEFENIEPLKIGAGGNDKNQTEPSRDYIPGSTIRGAIIGALIKKGIFADKQKEFLTQLKCFNAYPFEKIKQNKGALYIPTPCHLRMNKHDWRRTKAENKKELELNNLLKEKSQAENKKEAKNVLEYKFVTIKNDALVGTKIQKEYRLHHTKNKKKENLFRYQAISAKQNFRSLVQFTDDLGKDIEYILQQGTRFYLGGSKGSGYGLCELKYVSQVYEKYKSAREELGLEYEYKKNNKTDNYLTITCLSDCICRNEEGQPVSYIPEVYIEKVSGLQVRLINKQIQTGITEGYNTKWRARYPKETTIKAGSILQYELIGNKGNQSAIEDGFDKLGEKLIGHRIQDGFGWIGVNIPFPEELPLKEGNIGKAAEDKEANNITKEIKEDKKLEAVLKIFSKGLNDNAKQRWLKMICIKSLESAEGSGAKNLFISEQLKNHHINQLMKELEPILDKLKRKQLVNNKGNINRDYAINAEKCSIAGLDFKQIIEYLTDNLDRRVDYSHLGKYAEEKLKTQKGQLFYLDCKNAEKLFIAELLYVGLHIQQRRRKDEQDS